MKKEHFKIVQEYIDDNPDSNNTEIADLLFEDRVIDKAHRTLRLYVGQVRGQAETDLNDTDDKKATNIKVDVPTAVPVEVKIEVEEEEEAIDGYKLKYSKDTVEVPYAIADKIFCAYSRKGLNYNRPQILSVLDIDRKIFDVLVSRLGLSKESEALSPHTTRDLTFYEQSEKVDEITAELLEKFAESDSTIVESVVKEYKKKVTDLVLDVSRKEAMYEHIYDMLPQVSISKYLPDDRIAKELPLYVVIGDMHIGVETDSFNIEKAREALRSMSLRINYMVETEGYKEVYLIFLGDVPHTISGVNHANMWKDIEQGLWGAAAIIKPYELLTEFISNTHNITKIYAVGGNHGRMAQHKDLEPTDEGEKLIFYMIQNTFKDSLEVIWDPDKVIFTKSNLTFIILHGDQGQDKRSGQDIAWNLGKNGTYNMILVGHTHSRQIAKNDDGTGYRKMVCPAFCPTDSYAERLGYNSLPGYLFVMEDPDGLPIVIDNPIYYSKIEDYDQETRRDA